MAKKKSTEPVARQGLDENEQLYVSRTFDWNGKSLKEGAPFNTRGLEKNRLHHLWRLGFIDHDASARLADPTQAPTEPEADEDDETELTPEQRELAQTEAGQQHLSSNVIDPADPIDPVAKKSRGKSKNLAK